MIAFAVMLISAALAAWIVSTDMPSAARAYLRFACVLIAALGVAAGLDTALAMSTALVVCAVASSMLAMAVRPAAPSLVLGLSAVLGIAAALTGIALLAFAPLLLSSVAMILARRAYVRMWAASLALVAGAACLVMGDLPALMAFLAAGLLGISLVLRDGGRGTAPPVRSVSDRPAGGSAARTTPAR